MAIAQQLNHVPCNTRERDVDLTAWYACNRLEEWAFRPDWRAHLASQQIAIEPDRTVEVRYGDPCVSGTENLDGTHGLVSTTHTPPFTWAPAPGDFPTEFQVDASGRISGSPSATGSSSALVECTDRWGAVALQTVTFDAGALADLSRRRTSEKLVFESGGAGHVTRALELTEGSLLSVTLTGGRVGDEPPQLAFTDSAGVEIDLAPFTRTTKRAVAVKGLVIPATGRWFLTATVAPQFAGRVRLTIGVTPRAAWPAAATIDAGGMEDFEFSAPPGALVSVAVRAAKGSAAVPTVLHVIGPDEIDLAPAGRTSEKTGSATFSSRTPLAGGDYLVVIGARDGTAGEITWTVKLRLPRAYEFSMPDVPAGD